MRRTLSVRVSSSPNVRVSPPAVEQDTLFSNAKQQVCIRNRSATGPCFGRHSGSRTIEFLLPSVARWKVSATNRPPTPVSLPLLSSASRST